MPQSVSYYEWDSRWDCPRNYNLSPANRFPIEQYLCYRDPCMVNTLIILFWMYNRKQISQTIKYYEIKHLQNFLYNFSSGTILPLFLAYTIKGRGNLVWNPWHSVPHFPFDFLNITRWVAKLNGKIEPTTIVFTINHWKKMFIFRYLY